MKKNHLSNECQTSADEPHFSAIKIIRLASLLTTAADKLLMKQCDLTHAQFSVLMVITCTTSPTQTIIADHLKLTTAAVSRLIDILTVKKMVTRTIDPHNRRANMLTLTSLGKRRVKKGITVLQAAETKVFASLQNPHTFFASVDSLSETLRSLFA